MKKQTVEYLNKCVNVTQDEFVLGREPMGSQEVIIVGIPGCKDPLYTLIHFKKARSKFKIESNTEELARIEKVIPKGTGGEKAYAMLILSELEKYNIGLESSGLLMKFILHNLEWNTGKLIRKRDKVTLTKEMMSEQYKIGKIKLKKVLSELKGIIDYNPKTKAYYLNRNIVKKGAGT